MGANASHETRKKVDVLWKDVDELSEEAKDFLEVLKATPAQEHPDSIGAVDPEGLPEDHSDIVDSVIDDNEMYPQDGEVEETEVVGTGDGENVVEKVEEEEDINQQVEEELVSDEEKDSIEKVEDPIEKEEDPIEKEDRE